MTKIQSDGAWLSALQNIDVKVDLANSRGDVARAVSAPNVDSAGARTAQLRVERNARFAQGVNRVRFSSGAASNSTAYRAQLQGRGSGLRVGSAGAIALESRVWQFGQLTQAAMHIGRAAAGLFTLGPVGAAVATATAAFSAEAGRGSDFVGGRGQGHASVPTREAPKVIVNGLPMVTERDPILGRPNQLPPTLLDPIGGYEQIEPRIKDDTHAGDAPIDTEQAQVPGMAEHENRWEDYFHLVQGDEDAPLRADVETSARSPELPYESDMVSLIQRLQALRTQANSRVGGPAITLGYDGVRITDSAIRHKDVLTLQDLLGQEVSRARVWKPGHGFKWYLTSGTKTSVSPHHGIYVKAGQHAHPYRKDGHYWADADIASLQDEVSTKFEQDDAQHLGVQSDWPVYSVVTRMRNGSSVKTYYGAHQDVTQPAQTYRLSGDPKALIQYRALDHSQGTVRVSGVGTETDVHDVMRAAAYLGKDKERVRVEVLGGKRAPVWLDTLRATAKPISAKGLNKEVSYDFHLGQTQLNDWMYTFDFNPADISASPRGSDALLALSPDQELADLIARFSVSEGVHEGSRYQQYFYKAQGKTGHFAQAWVDDMGARVTVMADRRLANQFGSARDMSLALYERMKQGNVPVNRLTVTARDELTLGQFNYFLEKNPSATFQTHSALAQIGLVNMWRAQGFTHIQFIQHDASALTFVLAKKNGKEIIGNMMSIDTLIGDAIQENSYSYNDALTMVAYSISNPPLSAAPFRNVPGANPWVKEKTLNGQGMHPLDAVVHRDELLRAFPNATFRPEDTWKKLDVLGYETDTFKPLRIGAYGMLHTHMEHLIDPQSVRVRVGQDGSFTVRVVDHTAYVDADGTLWHDHVARGSAYSVRDQHDAGIRLAAGVGAVLNHAQVPVHRVQAVFDISDRHGYAAQLLDLLHEEGMQGNNTPEFKLGVIYGGFSAYPTIDPFLHLWAFTKPTQIQVVDNRIVVTYEREGTPKPLDAVVTDAVLAQLEALAQ